VSVTGGLTPRQKRFVDAYLLNPNATQAAIRAGYGKKNADVVGPRLLGDVGVAAAIADGQQRLAAEVGLSQIRVLRELEGLAHSDVSHYLFDDVAGRLKLAEGAPPNAMRAVSSIKYRTRTDGDGNVSRECEFKLWDKPGMVRLTGRHLSMKGFSNTLELDAKGLAAPVVNVYTGIAPPADAEPDDGGKDGA